VRKDLETIGSTYGDKRRCKLVRDNVEIEFNAEDYVVHEDVFAIVTTDGWIKRIRQTNELSSTRLREGDSIKRALPLSTTDAVAFFTNHGTLYVLKVADFPASSGYGDPVQKILKFKDGETIVDSFGVKAKASDPALIPGHEIREGDTLVLVSRQGVGFALIIEGLESLKRSGKRAIKLRDGDALAGVCRLEGHVGFFTEKASGLIVPGKEIPQRNTAAVGVSLIGVRSDDRLVGVVSFNRNAKLAFKLSTGKQVEIPSSEICSGHRALKGTKVVARGEIISVEKVGA
jgi:DNA gyrase subunit A